jgi:hypothetical protein
MIIYELNCAALSDYNVMLPKYDNYKSFRAMEICAIGKETS